MADCVILIGLPGAGKTTFYRTYFAGTHKLVSTDLWPNARHREDRQRRILGDALAHGESVVVDNTNPSPSDREPLASIAHAHHARVIGYFFDVSTPEAVVRNAGRTGRQRVPAVAIFTAAKRMQPPTANEGFDQLFLVRPLPGQMFSIREWRAEA